MSVELTGLAAAGLSANLSLTQLIKKYLPKKWHWLTPLISMVIGVAATFLMREVSDEAMKLLLINMLAPLGVFDTYRQYNKHKDD